MFYSHFILAKKGPLARIWLAAHWDKKLTKAHVFETNIEKSVDGIIRPKVKLALRTSGHLLLGVVRIYSRKAKYLLADCNEAFVKIKMAFRPGMVDLPEEHREAAVNAITLPEVFHDFDTTMPELNDVDIEAQFSLNQSRAEEITMREDYGNISLVNHDDGFGDMGFDTEAPEFVRHAGDLEPSMEQSNLLFSEPVLDTDALDKENEPIPSTSGTQPHEQPMEIDPSVRDDTLISSGLFEGGLFDEAPMVDVPPVDATIPAPQDLAGHADSDDDGDMDNFGGPPSVGGMSSDDSRPPISVDRAPSVVPPAPSPAPSARSLRSMQQTPAPTAAEAVAEEVHHAPALDQTILVHNDEESFALAPVDTSVLKDMYYLGVTKSKRKRKLIIDEVKNISGEEMKNQLSDTSDIITTLDLAPPTKRLMHWKETGGVEKLFALPARVIPARVLFKSYQRHLTLRAIRTEDFAMLGDADSLAIDQGRDHEEPTPSVEITPPPAARRGRKRKVAEEPNQTPLHVPETSFQPSPIEEPLSHLMPSTPAGLPFQSPVHLQPPPTPVHFPPPGTPLQMAPDMAPGTPLAPFMTPHMPGQPPPYPQTPAPPTPLHHMPDDMPHLPPDQVRSILQEQENMGMVTSMTPGGPDDLLGPQDMTTATPIEPQLPPEPLEQLQEHLQPMENMGYDQMANMGYEEHAHPRSPTGGMSERAHSPWQPDYDFPASVGPNEEQQVDETDEQFEERVLNKRAYQLFLAVRTRLQQSNQMTLTEVCHRNNKKQAAQKFYSLLVLKKFQVLELEQADAYDEIFILKGLKFENPVI
ncbi:double-strand-break repair protein rad21 homolog isoform X2 [Cylas formicarius]|uniref:double-strand-break repair protein rad21 homolog isoform X2 n=1 Tax=Cylas formicarius TaxID=197179 RepID=UPI0029585476|nr:double-strand-break repair protein rad21 homolog isoform X2 [Cylas formicarius]